MKTPRRLSPLLAGLVLAACANPAQRLQPGVAGASEVRAVLGEPAMSWRDPDGSRQLAYPGGPAETHTWMVWLDGNGRVSRVENVLQPSGFARIQAGMSKEAVLRVLGPPQPHWTEYFAARDELVWEWRYCNEWLEPARFDVLFDASTGTVRSTLSLTESQIGGQFGPRTCGR